MNVLSIQSHVAYGHVGNASAVFALQRLGIEVWPVHTVQFSNHTGYGAWRGRVFDGPSVDELVEGIADRGVLGTCDADAVPPGWHVIGRVVAPAASTSGRRAAVTLDGVDVVERGWSHYERARPSSSD